MKTVELLRTWAKLAPDHNVLRSIGLTLTTFPKEIKG